MFAFVVKAAGWAIAHKDAIVTGFKVFKALRGRRKDTQDTGESVKAYYLREGRKVVADAASNLK